METNQIRGGLTVLLVVLASAYTAFALAQTYEGPLLESHAHIVPYQSERQSVVQYRVDAREGATELTAASYVSSLDRNNIQCTVGFHGIAFDGKQQELLDHATRLIRLYPDRFVLFAEIFRHNPLDWFNAATLDPLLATGLFDGLGEIQFANEPLSDDETETPIVFPNDPRFLEIYTVLGDRGLFMMAHPAARTGLGQAVSHDPRVTWIIHGPQAHSRWQNISALETLLNNNSNLYYTLDIGESLPEFLELMKSEEASAKDVFLAAMNDDVAFNALLDRMVTTWKSVIERHPNRFLWGTDMALPTWHWDPEVIDRIMQFSRTFIGRLASPAAENYAYKNAERLLGGCPVPIDIKPGSYPNSINLGSGGTVPVAIMSSTRFDATTVDPTSVTLASAPVQLKGKGTPMASLQDVNGDGLPDLVVHVSTEALQLGDTDMVAVLGGQTYSGTPINGRDTIRVVP